MNTRDLSLLAALDALLQAGSVSGAAERLGLSTPAVSHALASLRQELSRDKHVMPWRIEDEVKALGANFVQAGLWRSFAVRDGNLITGQQNSSGGGDGTVGDRGLGPLRRMP